MQKLLLLLGLLLLPAWLTATTYDYSNSCDYLKGKQAKVNCYDQYNQIIPLANNKLPEGQELVDTFRCGRRLLQVGMTMEEVKQSCSPGNQPTDIKRYIQSFEVHHRGFYGYHYVSFETYDMERWTFKKYGRFRTYVIFRDGEIYQIIQDRNKRN